MAGWSRWKSDPRVTRAPSQRQTSTANSNRKENCGGASGYLRIGSDAVEIPAGDSKELRIGDLNRDAGFAQRNVLQFPSGVGFAFGVGIGGVAVAEFDGVGSVKIARLHALTLDPYILDARNFSGQVPDTFDRALFIGVGGCGIPFKFDDMQDGFGLPEAVLAGHVTGGKERGRQK